MHSLNPAITALHQAFCDCTARHLPMNATFERWWFEALRYDITPAMVQAVMVSRMKRDYSNSTMKFYCLSLRSLIGDDERLAQFVDEAAQLEALKRKKVYCPGKADVMIAMGRPGEPEPAPAKLVGQIIEEMRRAAI